MIFKSNLLEKIGRFLRLFTIFVAGWLGSYFFYSVMSGTSMVESGRTGEIVTEKIEKVKKGTEHTGASYSIDATQINIVHEQQFETKLATALSPELSKLEILNAREGGLSNNFAMGVGLTPFEEKKIESLLSEYDLKLKILQMQHLVESPNSNGLRYTISKFSDKGETLHNEFITKIKESIDETTYSKFMSYASHEISCQMGDFGKSSFEFSFESDNGESVLNVKRDNVELAAPETSRFIGMSIPPKYSHLFIFDENKN